jgi:hypothetical protein
MNNGTCCRWCCPRARHGGDAGARPPICAGSATRCFIWSELGVRGGCYPGTLALGRRSIITSGAGADRAVGRPSLMCFGTGFDTRPANAASPPPPSWTRRPLVRPSGRARLGCRQENQRHQTSCPGGHVGVALGRLCHQSRRARTTGSPPLAGRRAGWFSMVTLFVGRPRLRRRGVGRGGGGASQDRHFTAGGRATPPRSAWL